METPKHKTQNVKHKLLKALFAEAARLGINQETLRETIAPAVIRKRLSQARPQEVARVLDHLKGRDTESRVQTCRNPNCRDTERRVPTGKKFRYESSRAGLLEEIKDLAIERFGQDFVVPLNNLCARFGESDGYRKMRIAGLKELKLRLKELNKKDPWEIKGRDTVHRVPTRE